MVAKRRKYELGVELKSRNHLNRGFSSAQRSITAFGTGLTSRTSGITNALGGIASRNIGIAAAASGAIMSRFAANSAGAAIQFQKGMHEVWTLLPDVSKEQLGIMSSQVRNFSKDSIMPLDTSVRGLYQTISAGIVKKPFEFLKVSAKSARGGVTDIQTSVDGLSSAVNSFKNQSLTAADAADSMFTGVRIGKTTFPELAQVIGQVAPVASAVNITFSELIASIAALTTTGLSTDEAATQLRRTLFSLSKDGTNVSKIFKEIAGEAFSEFILKGGTLQEALRMLNHYAKANSTSLLNLFSNIRAGQGAVGLAVTGADMYTRSLDAMTERVGAADEANRKMLDATATSVEKLKVYWHDAKVSIGEDFAEMALEVIPSLIQAFELMPKVIGPVFDWLQNEGKAIENMLDVISFGAYETAAEQDQRNRDIQIVNDKFLYDIVQHYAPRIGMTARDFTDKHYDSYKDDYEALMKIIDQERGLYEAGIQGGIDRGTRKYGQYSRYMHEQSMSDMYAGSDGLNITQQAMKQSATKDYFAQQYASQQLGGGGPVATSIGDAFANAAQLANPLSFGSAYLQAEEMKQREHWHYDFGRDPQGYVGGGETKIEIKIGDKTLGEFVVTRGEVIDTDTYLRTVEAQ